MELQVFLMIMALAFSTYMRRIVGYLAFSNRQLSPYATRVIQAVPGCVLIAVITLVIVSGSIANMVAVGITCLVMLKFSLLPTVLVVIVVTGGLRQLGF